MSLLASGLITSFLFPITDVSDIPLPHGPRARFLQWVDVASGDSVTARASLRQFLETFGIAGTVDVSEWALELLAQAAPPLLAPGYGAGTIAKVEFLKVHRPLTPANDPVFVRLKRLSPPDSPLAHFRGTAGPDRDGKTVLVEAEFKLARHPANAPTDAADSSF